MSDCLFCKIAEGEIPAKIVYSDDRIVAFEDIQPQAPHHLLIIPRKHIRTVLDLTTADNELIGHIYQVAGKLAHDIGISEDGFRLVAGGTTFGAYTSLLGDPQVDQ